MKFVEPFRLDTANHCLWRGEDRVSIPPKAFDVLRYLVENPGRLVTQDELLDAVWPDTHVNPEILRKYILDVRKILGDRHDKPVFIETVTKRGYRFVAPVIDGKSTAELSDVLTPRINESSQSAAELHADLKRLSGDTTSGNVVATTDPAGRLTWQWATAIALVVFVGAAAFAWLGQGLNGSDASDQKPKKGAAILAVEAVFAQYAR